MSNPKQPFNFLNVRGYPKPEFVLAVVLSARANRLAKTLDPLTGYRRRPLVRVARLQMQRSSAHLPLPFCFRPKADAQQRQQPSSSPLICAVCKQVLQNDLLRSHQGGPPRLYVEMAWSNSVQRPTAFYVFVDATKELTLLANVLMSKGFVITSMPGARPPSPMIAASAYPVMNNTFKP